MSYSYVVHCNNMFVYSLSQGGRFSSHVGASELIGREGGVCKQEEGLLWWTQPESQDRVILESWVEGVEEGPENENSLPEGIKE